MSGNAVINRGNIYRPIGIPESVIKIPTEGTDSNGREVTIVKDESPTRIEEVNTNLYYIGYAELDSDESANVWKIKKIELIDGVWYNEYAFANQYYRYKWSERKSLPYG